VHLPISATSYAIVSLIPQKEIFIVIAASEKTGKNS